ncbi:MAG: hypothetical protein CVU61_02165 [Deltaproteobacteria bacterium HGW-Deltaproteobacteria-19]|jgi:phage gp37-like protein|nr:MAG: hypothetical protein CVU61_02165 [Deltaproteobacteria bacterium HGW-Deltaproteobacteria-19]
MYTIEQIEDAITTRLAPLKVGHEGTEPDPPAVWRTVRTIKSYQGELDDEESIARATKLFPAILAVYGGSEYASHGARKVEKMRFHLFVCDRSLRAEEEARRGGSGNPGVYALLNGVRDLLVGQRLSLEIYPFELSREEAVWFGKGISIYGALYETAQPHLYPGG